MKVLIVHNILWAHYKAVVFQEVHRLAQQHPTVDVSVIQIARNERSRAGLEQASSEAPTYDYPYRLLFDCFLEDIGTWERTRALLKELWRIRPDVLNLTGYYDPAQLIMLIVAKLMGIRVIMQNESTAADHARGGWKEIFKRFIFRLCNGFFCFGSQSAQYLLQLGVRPEQILLRKNAVDNKTIRDAYLQALYSRKAEQEQLQLQPFNFIFVGRLIEVKNLKALINAFAQAQQKLVAPVVEPIPGGSGSGLPDRPTNQWGLILLGDGPLQPLLQTQINSLGLSDGVHILPGRPWFKVPDVLALADVLVLPSRSEPWGLVVNEAMACGMPVLVSDRCGCVADLVQHGQNGLIIDPDKPEQLIEALCHFMTGNVNHQKMGEVAQQLIQPYAPEAVAQDMLTGFLKISHLSLVIS